MNKDFEKFNTVIELLSRLPGVGSRTAKRYLLYMLKKNEKFLPAFISALDDLSKNVTTCSNCFQASTSNPCYICNDERREKHVVCVVENMSSLWAVEDSRSYKGLYHVIGENISISRAESPEKLKLDNLITKIESGQVKEVILALSMNVEGQTTLHYIYEHISNYDIKITTLAQGVPIGGELNYLDDVTIGKALNDRKIISFK